MSSKVKKSLWPQAEASVRDQGLGACWRCSSLGDAVSFSDSFETLIWPRDRKLIGHDETADDDDDDDDDETRLLCDQPEVVDLKVKSSFVTMLQRDSKSYQIVVC